MLWRFTHVFFNFLLL